jgi:quercetin dioxygenase-like cupin family protein
MAVVAEPMPRPEWAILPRPGCVGVDFRVLLQRSDLVLAQLRFAPHATIDEHSATFDVDVVCLDGAGMFSVDAKPRPLRAGETVRWPADRPHRLWTEGTGMVTLMVEHPRR